MNSSINSIDLQLMKLRNSKRLEFLEQILDKSEREYWQDVIEHKRAAIDSIKSQRKQLQYELNQAEKLNQHLENGISIFQQATCEVEQMVSNLEESDQDFEEIKNLISIRNEVYIQEDHEMELALQDLENMEMKIKKMKEIEQLQQVTLQKISQKYDQDVLICNFIQRQKDELSKMAQMKMNEEKQWQLECEQKKNNIDQIKKKLDIYQPKLDQFVIILEKLLSNIRQVNDLIDKKLSKLNKRLKTLEIQTMNQTIREEESHKFSIYQMKSQELIREEDKKKSEKDADDKIEFETFQAMKNTSALSAWKEIHEDNLLAEKISLCNHELESLQLENERMNKDLSKMIQDLSESESSKREEMSQQQKVFNVLQQSILLIEEEKSKLKEEIDQVKSEGESLSEKLNTLNER